MVKLGYCPKIEQFFVQFISLLQVCRSPLDCLKCVGVLLVAAT